MNEELSYYACEGQATSANEAITLCGDYLYRNGCVDKGFSTACIERENEYPTGIDCDIPVAIPHCKSLSIKQNAICYLRLQFPVKFKRLDDDEQTVCTRHIFNLAIKDGEQHLSILSRMMQGFTDRVFMNRLEYADINDIPALLNHYFNDRDNNQ